MASDYGPNLQILNFVTYKDTVFSVTEVGYKAFFKCFELRTIHIGFCIEIVRFAAFSQCWNVTSLTFDQNSRLQIIEDFGFYDFYSLTSLTFTGDNLTEIGIGAFAFTFVLKSVIFPPSVTPIKVHALRGLDSLKSVQYCGSTAITENVFDREPANGHATPSNIIVKVTRSYPTSKFATDTVSVDNSISCNFPKAITYNLICKSHNYTYVFLRYSILFAFLII